MGGSTVRIIVGQDGGGEIYIWAPEGLPPPLVSIVIGGLIASDEAVAVESNILLSAVFNQPNISRTDYINVI